MRIIDLGLRTAADLLPKLRGFYRSLGVSLVDGSEEVALKIGATTIRFAAADSGSAPFYHFALRVPRNRLAAAMDLLEKHVGLLPDPETGTTTFDFDNWNAVAFYFHDPAGNIVELIAHRDLPDEGPDEQPFAMHELLGVCEIGLVGDVTRMAQDLDAAGIELWDGSVEPSALAFMGGRDGVLILAPTGRGWLPTRRPAEEHAVDVAVEGRADRHLGLHGTPHRVQIRRMGSS